MSINKPKKEICVYYNFAEIVKYIKDKFKLDVTHPSPLPCSFVHDYYCYIIDAYFVDRVAENSVNIHEFPLNEILNSNTDSFENETVEAWVKLITTLIAQEFKQEDEQLFISIPTY